MQALLRDSANWYSTGFDLGETQLQLQMRDDPQHASAELRGDAGVQRDFQPRAVVSLNGKAGGFAWVAGNSAAFGAALSAPGSAGKVRSLTRGTAPLLDMPGTYAAFSTRLSAATDLTFGFAELQQTSANAPIAAMRGSEGHMSGVSLTHSGQNLRLSLQALGLMENGTVLGSVSAGGLRLADRAATVAAVTKAELALSAEWSLQADAGLAWTDTTAAPGSLVTALGPIVSSGYSFGLARQQLFAPDDALTFTVTQPQRVERANAALVLEAGGVPANGDVVLSHRSASLVPSGREMAFETGYRASFGGWLVQTNLAYRLDAGHIAGREDVRAALTLNRRF
jgi:hypothetical protein